MSVPGDSATNPLHLVQGTEPPGADWETVYRQHVVALYRYAYARIGNRPDAEDGTSAVFMRALPRLRQACSDGETSAYLRATARTVLADLWRDRHGVTTAELDEETLGDAGVDEAAQPDIEHLLRGLPPHYRRVLELRFLRGYSIRETAEVMGISVSNAKVLQLRALRRAAREEGASR